MIDDISNLLGSREPVNALLGSRKKPQLEVFTVEFGDDAVDVAYYGATFADQGPLPLHGFARTLRWTRIGGEGRDDCATATFALRKYGVPGGGHDALTSDETMGWDPAFELLYTVSVGRNDDGSPFLGLELGVKALTPFEFTTCLHTYLRFDDVRDVRLAGLRGVAYYDKVAAEDRVEDEDAIAVEQASIASCGSRPPAAGFVDRIYHETRGRPLTLTVAGGEIYTTSSRRRPTATRSSSTPGSRASAGRRAGRTSTTTAATTCASSQRSRATGPVALAAGESWAGKQTITIRAA
ncbi:glucose-6-phosphate 1-epimerase [Aureococcus anophagefferens]|nr:glucose-6-phosphate 1-epimerase [Aureococcus anophagefferens]